MAVFLSKGLKRVDRSLHRLCHLGWGNPRSTVFIFLLFTTIVGCFLPRLKAVISMQDLVGQEFPAIQNYLALEDRFSLQNPAALFFESKSTSGWKPRELCAIHDFLETERMSNPEIVQILSPFGVARVSTKDDVMTFDTVLQYDCPITDESPQPITSLESTPWGRIISSPTGNDFVAEIVFRDTQGGSRFGKFDPKPVDDLITRTRSFLQAQSISGTVSLSGEAAFQWFFLKGLEHDQAVNGLAVLVVLILFKFLFGTWVSGVLMVLSLLVTGTIVFGLMALFHVPIDVLNNCLFMMITVAALQDFVFLSSYQKKHRTGLRETFDAYITPSFFTSLTTMIGFGSLYFGDLEPVRRFGLWAGIGAGVEWMVTFVFLPALLRLIRRWQFWTKPKPQRDSGRPMAWLRFNLDGLTNRLLTPAPRTLAYLILAVGYLGVLSIPLLNFADSSIYAFPEDHRFRNTLDRIKDSRGWEGSINVEVDQNLPDSDRRKLLEEVTHLGNVARVESPLDILDFVVGETPPIYDQVVRFELSHTRFYKRYFSDDGRILARAYLAETDNASVAETVRQIEALCPKNCRVSGAVVSYEEFSRLVIPSLFKSFAGSLILVGLLLAGICVAVGYREWIKVVGISLWAVWPSITLVALMGYRVNFITCVFASVLVGIAGDNSIQFLLSSQGKRGRVLDIETKASGSVNVVVLMSAVSTLFVFSAFAPPRLFGPLFCVNLFITLIGDVWLLVGLTQKDGRRRGSDTTLTPAHPKP